MTEQHELMDWDLMPFGRYAGVPMVNVPATELHFRWQSGIKHERSPLNRYIRDSLETLKQEAPHLNWD